MTDDGAQVRIATCADLRLLRAIEDAGDELFPTVFPDWELGPPPSGAERAAEPGWLLVAGDPVSGFAHAVRLDGEALLDQGSVLPARGRRGRGRPRGEVSPARFRSVRPTSAGRYAAGSPHRVESPANDIL